MSLKKSGEALFLIVTGLGIKGQHSGRYERETDLGTQGGFCMKITLFEEMVRGKTACLQLVVGLGGFMNE